MGRKLSFQERWQCVRALCLWIHVNLIIFLLVEVPHKSVGVACAKLREAEGPQKIIVCMCQYSVCFRIFQLSEVFSNLYRKLSSRVLRSLEVYQLGIITYYIPSWSSACDIYIHKNHPNAYLKDFPSVSTFKSITILVCSPFSEPVMWGLLMIVLW